MEIRNSAASNMQNYHFDNSLLKMNKKIKPDDENKLKQACNEFEAIFIQQIFKEMRKTKISSMMDGGMGEDIFKDMLYDEYSKMAADKSSIGLSQIAYDYLCGQNGAVK